MMLLFLWILFVENTLMELPFACIQLMLFIMAWVVIYGAVCEGEAQYARHK